MQFLELCQDFLFAFSRLEHFLYLVEIVTERSPILYVLAHDGCPELRLTGKFDARHNSRKRCMSTVIQCVHRSELFTVQSGLWFIEGALPSKTVWFTDFQMAEKLFGSSPDTM